MNRYLAAFLETLSYVAQRDALFYRTTKIVPPVYWRYGVGGLNGAKEEEPDPVTSPEEDERLYPLNGYQRQLVYRRGGLQ